MKKGVFIIAKVIILTFVVLIVLLLATRFVLSKQIDDVNPFMGCSEDELAKADIFYIVPIYNDIPINESTEWCEKILAMNKTLYLHGIYHTYREFEDNINLEEFNRGREIFKDCFGFYPQHFKAPQLAFAKDNKWILDSFDLNLDGEMNHLFHKVYHCNDSGIFPNSFYDWF